MNEREFQQILPVRAVEEANSDGFADQALDAARREAGDPNELSPCLARRAAYLIPRLDPFNREASLSSVPTAFVWVAVAAIASVIGVSSNWLGDAKTIHALANPISVLIAWNLLAYVVWAVSILRGRTRRVQEVVLRDPIGALA